ncbi:hypothetical protein [Novosphingobium resinovorum]|uniref:hypothetical protein n=1 Tax=Novosphingobium resinovorum TaxID=158500 RepID=UPI002ED690BA|nr:hypothetical protein [Novosphingobium resinovorum]
MTGRFIYPPPVLDALFDAVETDDVVDPVVSLPRPIPVACEAGMMRRCLDLCVQFWREGAIRSDLRALTATLLLAGDLPQDARRRYKLIRARYKHLRFALVLYGSHHRVPPLFGATVAVMGHLQDAFRNRRRAAVLGYALLLRLLVAWPVWLAVRREVDGVRLDDAPGFLRYRAAEMGRLGQWLAQAPPTAHRFHAMRKIVSRQVAFYDTMRTLEPDERILRMSRFLAAINGLMGSLHDDLVEGAVAGRRDYHRDPVPLPDDIRTRLHALAEAYPVN